MCCTSLALAASCSAWQADPDGFTEQERALIASMALGPDVTVSDGSNPFLGDGGAQALGQALFFDPELSGPLGRSQPNQLVSLGEPGSRGRIACVDCHAPTGFFDDTRSTPGNVSLGIDFTPRNSPSLINVALYRYFAWDGRSDSLWMQCGFAHESKGALGGTRLRLARRIAGTYAAQYQALVGDAGFARLARDGGEETEFDFLDGGQPAPDSLSARYLNQVAANSYKAMAAYLSQLVSVDSAFDDYARGNLDALSPPEKRGLKLFLGRAGCIECHRGPNFTDHGFHSVGVPQRGEHVPLIDQGRFEGVTLLGASVFNRCGEFGLPSPDGVKLPCSIPEPQPEDVGQFRTKSLRNVGRTAPYMHAGQLQTLEQVVHFYNAGGETTGFVGTKSPKTVPLGLTEAEILDLVAFLHALTGKPVDPALTCDSSPRDTDAGNHRFPACAGAR